MEIDGEKGKVVGDFLWRMCANWVKDWSISKWAKVPSNKVNHTYAFHGSLTEIELTLTIIYFLRYKGLTNQKL